jgi:hypothetical protein
MDEESRAYLEHKIDYDDDVPGGTLANILRGQAPADVLWRRDDSCCAWCAKPAAPELVPGVAVRVQGLTKSPHYNSHPATVQGEVEGACGRVRLVLGAGEYEGKELSVKRENAVPVDARKLLICSRCRGVRYCDRLCFKAAWKGDATRPAHKDVCTSSEQRVAKVLELLGKQGEDASQFEAAVVAALQATGERVWAAYHLLYGLLPSHGAKVVYLASGYHTTRSACTEFCAALSLVYSTRIIAASMDIVEAALPPAERAALEDMRRQEAQVGAERAAAMVPILNECDAIFSSLLDVMGGCWVLRHLGPTRPHQTTRDLLTFVHGTLCKADAGDRLAHRPWCKIPRFLALALELLTPPIDYAPDCNGGLSKARIKAQHERLRAQVCHITCMSHERPCLLGLDVYSDYMFTRIGCGSILPCN